MSSQVQNKIVRLMMFLLTVDILCAVIGVLSDKAVQIEIEQTR